MDTEFKVIAVIVIILLGVMAVFLIIALRALYKLLRDTAVSITQMTQELTVSVKNVAGDIEELKNKLTESIDNIDTATKQLTMTSKTIDDGFQRAFDVIEPVEQLVTNVYNRIGPPINTASLLVSASTKAFTTFFHVFGKKK